ncbi:MAG: glutamine--fructose-6-phosphate transaminase (isomerizing) [Candidatus Hatepunaea meridiana]|nr:glutamine--fructose-6-phosphate transaminase (isomerizing) [Candidatus Hatepunaea meridiana]
MCGIIGYIGHKEVLPVLMNGLRRMEYRGYDSSGVAVFNNGSFSVTKSTGKLAVLRERLEGQDMPGCTGLGHTRWATHGEPNELNAHPHTNRSGKIVIIHNGIIENYQSLKTELISKDYQFVSDTDSEVLAHLIEEFYEGDIEQAVRLALTQVKGTYGLVVACADESDKLIAARMGSPLIIGLGEGENLIASDLAAIIDHTRNVIFLDDGELAVVTNDNVTNTRLDHQIVNNKVEQIFFNIEEIEKDQFPYFMLKEIFGQPESVHDSMRGRLMVDEGTAKLGGLHNFEDELKEAKRFIIIACGTSWHSGMIGEYLLEDLAGIPVEVEYASEFRYRNPIIEPGTITLSISQSGETIDTLAAMRESKDRGAIALGICNSVGSTIARETDGGVYLHAGPEIGVASTKAFTSQVTVLTLLALKMGRQIGRITKERGQILAEEMMKLPEKIRSLIDRSDEIKRLAEKLVDCTNALYLSRGINFPVALEGALKLKEISYIHAEGYPAAEMKHGPIALIDENMPVIFIAVNGHTYEKVISNIEEVKARKGNIIAVVNEGDEIIHRYAHHVVEIPRTDTYLTPILSVIPLQLLAYHIAVLRGCDVDQPRNLAKAVTVE